MNVSPSARQHLFATIDAQYEADDAETLKSLLMSMSTDNLATKDDVGALRTEVAVVRDDVGVLRGDVGVLRDDVGVLRGEVGVLRDDVGVLRGDVGVLRGDMAALRLEIADFKVEIHEALARQTHTYISWMFGLLTAYTAVAGSFVGLATIILR